MNRVDFVNKLELVAPALAASEVVPILTHLCFTGKTVFAYNEQIGISAPCVTDFSGAVPGKLLLSFLKASRAKDVEFSGGDGALKIKAASSRFQLGLLPKSRFIWQPPEMADFGNALTSITDGRKLVAAIAGCLKSVASATMVPDQSGVTLIARKDEISVFATDNATLSYAGVPLSKSVKGWSRVILPLQFCKQMVSLSVDGKSNKLAILKDHALFPGKGGSLLFGNIIESQNPIDFVGQLKQSLPSELLKRAVSVPTKFELILERACVVASSTAEPVRMEIEIENGKAKFNTASKTSEIRDTMQVEASHPNATLSVSPKLVREGYGQFKSMLVTRDCFIFCDGGNAAYLVAAE